MTLPFFSDYDMRDTTQNIVDDLLDQLATGIDRDGEVITESRADEMRDLVAVLMFDLTGLGTNNITPEKVAA